MIKRNLRRRLMQIERRQTGKYEGQGLSALLREWESQPREPRSDDEDKCEKMTEEELRSQVGFARIFADRELRKRGLVEKQPDFTRYGNPRNGIGE